MFEVIICDKNKKYQLLPYNIKGYLTAEKDSDIWYNSEGKEAVVIDGIYSVVTERKGNVLKVINHEETEESYIVTDGINYSHGKTIQQAKESLIYKISDRDTSEYNSLTLNSVVSLEDGVKMYRKITGSCEEMTKAFVERLEKKKEYKISEIISLTKGQYNNEIFTKFFAK